MNFKISLKRNVIIHSREKGRERDRERGGEILKEITIL